VTATPEAPPWAPYHPEGPAYDEAILPDGTWRPEVARALEAARASDDLAALARRMEAAARRGGLAFPVEDGTEGFRVDPIPRVITAEDWEAVQRGVAQRIRALDAFVADVHGPRRAVAEGVVPERVITTAEHHEPEAGDLRPPGGTWIGLAGLDLVRRPDGRFCVLEDNVRTPSGIAYALAGRALTAAALGMTEADLPARPIGDAPRLLRETVRAASPAADPFVVVLTDGPSSSAYTEHRVLAEHLDAPLMTSDELALDGGRLVLRDAAGQPIDAVYRRTDDSSLRAPAHRDLIAALRAGTVGVINGFGTGVADDKLTHAYVEDLIRLFLGEEPVLPSLRTFDLQRDDDRAEALDRLAELVVKPRGGSGGHGVTIGPDADAQALDATRAAITEAPGDFVAQELVVLSTAPTIAGGVLAPRHVDLRPFAFLAADAVHVLPGGLTRVALPAGSMVVNSSQDGGAKDTWVLR
jgi:carboxylate-amine ligase